MDRAPHEGFFSVDKVTVWVAARGTDYVDIVDRMAGGIIGRVLGAPGPIKVLFSPDGATAYVNHIRSATLDIIDAKSQKVVHQISGLADTFSSDTMMNAPGTSIKGRAQARWVNLGPGLGAANCGYSIGYRCGNHPPEFCYRL